MFLVFDTRLEPRGARTAPRPGARSGSRLYLPTRQQRLNTKGVERQLTSAAAAGPPAPAGLQSPVRVARDAPLAFA